MSFCFVDIIDACNLRCPTCVRGTRLLPNTTRKMSKTTFEKIVKKANAEGYKTIGLFNWTEPFLNKQIPDYVEIIKKEGLYCDVSTNLSFASRSLLIRESLIAGIDNLIVSISGLTQEVYQRNHRGGSLGSVMKNLEEISKLQANGTISTRVNLRFLKFDYNMDEIAEIEAYATSLGIMLEIVEGVGHPDQPVKTYAGKDLYKNRLKNYVSESPYEKDGEVCHLIMDTISIDATGAIFICCAYPNYPMLKIGNYLEISKHQILMKRYFHPICSSCPSPRRLITESDREKLMCAFLSKITSQFND